MEPFVGPQRVTVVRTTTVAMANGAFAAQATSHQDDAMNAGQPFAAFFAANRNSLVRALAMTIGDSGLASEAVDEAMTRAVQRWDKVGSYSRPEGWVYRVAYNWATSRFRRRKRDREYAPRIARPEAVVDPEFDPTVEAALAKLSDEHRAVLVLRYFYDWDVQATAEALEISPGTVKSRTSRALDAMAKQLGADHDPSTTESPS